MTLNCQVVGFGIGCHEAIISFNDKFNMYHCSWGHEKYTWQS